MTTYTLDSDTRQTHRLPGRIASAFSDAVLRRYTMRHYRGPRWRGFRGVRLLTDVLLLLAIALVAFAAIGIGTGRMQLRPVLSGSMGHTLPLGSVAVTERMPLRDVAVGDILALHRPGTVNTTYVHRVISVRKLVDGTVVVQTKGDANKTPDQATVAIHGKYVYRVRHDIPWIGYAAVWLHNRAGGALLMGGGLFLVAGGWLMYRTIRERERAAADEAESQPTQPTEPTPSPVGLLERPMLPWTGWDE